MVRLALVVAAVVGMLLSRRNDLKRWRIMGMEAAIIVREDSLKPHITKGRALSVYRRANSQKGIARKSSERGLTAKVAAVKDRGDGGHFDHRRYSSTREIHELLIEKRKTRGYLHNAHAHGNGRTNLFPVVHVEPEQEPPGKQGE